MKKELDNYLCETYPKLFANRNRPMSETAMCWGFSCGDGWFAIIDRLCANIQNYIDWQNENADKGYKQYKEVPQVVVDQVKEKFGTLRFYYHGGDEHISGMVRMAESMTSVTCEGCGARGKLFGVSEKGITGWMHTYCEPCEEKRNKERELDE